MGGARETNSTITVDNVFVQACSHGILRTLGLQTWVTAYFSSLCAKLHIAVRGFEDF